LTGKLVNRSIPHISLHHVTRFEPITAAHFDQRYNKIHCVPKKLPTLATYQKDSETGSTYQRHESCQPKRM